VIEYYVELDGSTNYYPKAHSKLDVSLYADYGLENPSDDSDYRWEVSLIGNTEFFIKKYQ
jgi:hypothetical protein